MFLKLIIFVLKKITDGNYFIVDCGFVHGFGLVG